MAAGSEILIAFWYLPSFFDAIVRIHNNSTQFIGNSYYILMFGKMRSNLP